MRSLRFDVIFAYSSEYAHRKITSYFSKHRHITSFPRIEGPFRNAVESITSDCRCIIDSSDGRVWENSSRNTRSSILSLGTKSLVYSHNFASLTLEFSLFFSLYSILNKSSISSPEYPMSLINRCCFLSTLAILLIIINPSALVSGSDLSLITYGFLSKSQYLLSKSQFKVHLLGLRQAVTTIVSSRHNGCLLYSHYGQFYDCESL